MGLKRNGCSICHEEPSTHRVETHVNFWSAGVCEACARALASVVWDAQKRRVEPVPWTPPPPPEKKPVSAAEPIENSTDAASFLLDL
jgi:hypothetical protein